LILAADFSVFYLYDKISEMLLEQSQKRLLAEQNKYYEKQLDMMKFSSETTLSIRHDMKNHLLALRSLAQNHCHDELLQCFNDMIAGCEVQTLFSRSGNVVIDSIVNFKLEEAFKLGAKISVDINFPKDLELPAFDMVRVLGNLLDNAIDALKAIEDGRRISVKIKYGKGRLIIKVSNSFNGMVIEQTDGFMDIEYNATAFTSIVLMYVVRRGAKMAVNCLLLCLSSFFFLTFLSFVPKTYIVRGNHSHHQIFCDIMDVSIHYASVFTKNLHNNIGTGVSDLVAFAKGFHGIAMIQPETGNGRKLPHRKQRNRQERL
jgi:hypothetical protein